MNLWLGTTHLRPININGWHLAEKPQLLVIVQLGGIYPFCIDAFCGSLFKTLLDSALCYQPLDTGLIYSWLVIVNYFRP